MSSAVRHQLQEIAEKINGFEIGNRIGYYGNGDFVLKNGNVLIYFDDKTLEIKRIGIEIGTKEYYVKLRKQEISFLTKAFKKKLLLFNAKRDEKRILEEKEYLNLIKFNDNEKDNDI